MTLARWKALQEVRRCLGVGSSCRDQLLPFRDFAFGMGRCTIDTSFFRLLGARESVVICPGWCRTQPTGGIWTAKIRKTVVQDRLLSTKENVTLELAQHQNF
eukprot:scaffold405_cov132-Cylindrotheca_fusiformis.AAC.19